MSDTPILICYDGSQGAARAIGSASTLLGPRHAVVLDIAPPITPAESLATISPVARSSGFDAEARAELAPTWEGIADELDAAAIVIGSRGLSGLKEIAEGSLSHQVAEHAGRPVLIVPPPQHDGR